MNSALQKTREALYDRLGRYDYTVEQLKDKSLFQLVTLLHLLVGHVGYIGTYICTCRTLEGIFGEQFYQEERSDKTAPTPQDTVH